MQPIWLLYYCYCNYYYYYYYDHHRIRQPLQVYCEDGRLRPFSSLRNNKNQYCAGGGGCLWYGCTVSWPSSALGRGLNGRTMEGERGREGGHVNWKLCYDSQDKGVQSVQHHYVIVESGVNNYYCRICVNTVTQLGQQRDAKQSCASACHVTI